MDAINPGQLGLAQRRVMVSGPLDASTVAEACSVLMYLDGLSTDPLSVVVNSPGGPLGEALPLLDTLDLLRAPLTIDVLGRAHGSAGVVVAAAAGTRRIGRSASISLQLLPAASMAMASAEDLARRSAFERDLELAAATGVAERSGAELEWVQHQFDRGPVFSAQDAVTHGLVDDVR